MTDLAALLERVRRASGYDRMLDADICMALFPGLRAPAPHCIGDEPIFWDEPFYKKKVPHLTASIDAAVALVERLVQPGWRIAMERGDNYTSVQFVSGYGPMKQRCPPVERPDDELPLAIIQALLQAKIAEAALLSALETGSGR